MTKDDIQTRIAELMEKREKRTEITQDQVLKELASIAFDDIGNYLEFKTIETVEEILGERYPVYKTVAVVKDSGTIDTKNIQEVSIGRDGQFKFKLYGKDNALELLGRHLGVFNDKMSLTGDMDINITIDYGEDEDESKD